MHVTLKDIAKAVGVSESSVSHALEGRHDKVGPEMCEKIERTDREMDYCPNIVAKGLVSMMNRSEGQGRKLLITLIFLCCVLFFSREALSLTLVEKGVPRAVIVLGENHTSVEGHAAGELVKYINGMSGAKLRIVKCSGAEPQTLSEKNLILIGMGRTNPLIGELHDNGLIKLSGEHPGLDGFVIKTIERNPSYSSGKDCLVLGGSIDRGTLYAVYHLLETQLNVGFFEDGDRIPKRTTIMVDCDIAERPYFETRGSLISGPLSRNAAFWGEEEWKQEIDWLIKKRVNVILYIGQKWILDYGRERGMRFIFDGYDGNVSPAFMRAHPEVKYITITWPWTATTYHYIDPRDPFFIPYATGRIKSRMKDTGTDHFFSINPWAETPLPGKDEVERRQIRAAFARATTQALVNVDPESVNIMHGWAFGYREFYPSEDVKAYLDAVASDLIIMDMKAERGDPIHKQHNNFWGRKWLFCIMDGGEHQGIRGDVKDLIRKVRRVASDPETKNCVGLYSSSESLRYNFLYYDLLFTLGWDPRKVELQSFLKKYARRRYGREAAPTMLLCLEKLADSVYRQRSVSDFRHAQRLPHPYTPVSAELSSSLLAPVKEAVSIALKVRDKQAGNALYARDVIDMLRFYLDNALNLDIAGLETAFRSGNRKDFEKNSEAINYYLTQLEKLTSSWPDYVLQTRIDAAAGRPQLKEVPNDVYIRTMRVTASVEGYPAAADYNHCDYFELIRFYYRKRIELYIRTLREKMAKRINTVALKEFEPEYRRLMLEWVNNPIDAGKRDGFGGRVLDTAVQVFKAIEEREDRFRASSRPYKETKPEEIIDDGQVLFWEAGGDGQGSISAPEISDEIDKKESGGDSLRISVKDGGKHRRWYIQHKYKPPVDFSGKDLIAFYWYGSNSGGEIYICFPAPDWDNSFVTVFSDHFNGWKRLVFPFNGFKVYGNPSWEQISMIRIRSKTDNIHGTWYLDRAILDEAVREELK